MYFIMEDKCIKTSVETYKHKAFNTTQLILHLSVMLWFFACRKSILSTDRTLLLGPPYMFQLTLVTIVNQNVLIVHLLIISRTALKALNYSQTVEEFFYSPLGTTWVFESPTPYWKDERS